MQVLGPIVRLQIQRSPLKLGATKPREYDPAPILPVSTLVVSEPGAVTVAADGRLLVDVHHRDHPDTRSNGKNPLSLLFTSHYDDMRRRFGPHVADGIAGESILVECPRRQAVEGLSGGVIITTRDGEQVALDVLSVAPPCVEFTRFALGNPGFDDRDSAFLDALAFLSHGTRGFYVRYLGAPANLRIGDQVCLA